MCLELVLTFTGTIAFVPAAVDGQTLLHAVFIESRQSSAVADGAHLAGHYPVVLVPERWVAAVERAPAGAATSEKVMHISRPAVGGIEEMMTAWFLDRETLEIEATPGAADCPAAPLELVDYPEGQLPVGRQRPAPGEEENLSWTARMRDLAPPGRIVAGALASPADAQKVAARLTLAQGRVSAHALSGGLYEFRPLGAPATGAAGRALAGAVRARLRFPGCEVRLAGRRFDGTPGHALRLRSAECAAGQAASVEAELGNLLLEDILGVSTDLSTDVDRHFELHYGVLQAPPGARPVPHRVSQVASRTTGARLRIANPACPPSFMEP
jgi:hypothetical protein